MDKEFLDIINKGLSRNETVTFSANCEINYSGRAETYLPKGDRLFIIKADKTLIIHQPNGSAPVNYMKENTSHKIETFDDKIVLKSQNLALKEFMDIDIFQIHFANSAPLIDGQKIQLSGNERDMAEMIIKNPSMIENGFAPVSQEEQTKYGFIDVMGTDKNNNIIIIECKRYKGSLDNVSQLRRYVEKIKESKGIQNVRGILACNGITDKALAMLKDFGYEYKNIEPPKYKERFKKDQKSLVHY